MATRSILKTIKIADTKFCRSFADAIDKTKRSKRPEVQYQNKCEEINKEKVKSFFEKY